MEIYYERVNERSSTNENLPLKEILIKIDSVTGVARGTKIVNLLFAFINNWKFSDWIMRRKLYKISDAKSSGPLTLATPLG